MTEDFKVSITGDIGGLKKAVGEAEKELSAFASKSRELKQAIAETKAISGGYDQAIRELTGSFKTGAISQAQFKTGLLSLKQAGKETIVEVKRLELELANLNRTSAGLSKIVPQTSGHMHGMSKAVGDVSRVSSHSTNTMLEFSRVVQDAPYGIRGVANNIQQLVTNFGYLSTASGGAGAALKGMVASLMGPAGILLAVSLVTTLLVQYGDGLIDVSSKSSKLAKKNEELAKSFGTSNSVLEAEIGALDAQLEIMKLQKVSTKELLELKLKLLTASQSDLVNQQFALEAQLRNTKAVALEYSLWQKIINLSLKSRGMSPLPALIDAEEKEKIKELEIGIANVKQRIQETILEIGKITTPEIFDPEKIKEAIKEIQRLAIGEFDANLFNKLQAEDKKLYDKRQELLNDFLAEKEKKEIDSADELMNITFQKSTERLRIIANGNIAELALYDKYIELGKDKILSFEEWKKTIQGQGLAISIGKSTKDTSNILGDIENLLPKDIWGDLKFDIPPDLFSNLNSASDEQLKIFRANLQKTISASSIFNQAIGSSFSALSSSISNSLKTDSELVNAFVGSIINSMGALLTSLITTAITNLAIKETVATGNAVLAGTESAAATGPAAIWVMPAMIAAGVAMVAGAFASIGGFAGGGIVGGGSFNGDKVPAFVNSGEMILNGRHQNNLFDILDGNLRRLSAPSQMAQVSVTGELRGSTILLANARADKNNNRFYGRK